MESGNQLFVKQFTKLFGNNSLPSLFRWNPALLSPFELVFAWLISFQSFCRQNCFKHLFTAFSVRIVPWGYFRKHSVKNVLFWDIFSTLTLFLASKPLYSWPIFFFCHHGKSLWDFCHVNLYWISTSPHS